MGLPGGLGRCFRCATRLRSCIFGSDFESPGNTGAAIIGIGVRGILYHIYIIRNPKIAILELFETAIFVRISHASCRLPGNGGTQAKRAAWLSESERERGREMGGKWRAQSESERVIQEKRNMEVSEK